MKTPILAVKHHEVQIYILIHPVMPSGMFTTYHMDESFCQLKSVRFLFIFHFSYFEKKYPFDLGK